MEAGRPRPGFQPGRAAERPLSGAVVLPRAGRDVKGVRVAIRPSGRRWRPFERYASAVAPSPVIDLTDGFAHYQEKLWAKSRSSARI